MRRYKRKIGNELRTEETNTRERERERERERLTRSLVRDAPVHP